MAIIFTGAVSGFWQILFWLIMALWLFFGVIPGWPTAGTAAPGWRPFANSAVLWVLLALLGAFCIGIPGLPGR